MSFYETTGFFIFASILLIFAYVYYAYTWSLIARKLKYKKHWIAWIPIAQLFLLPILAKKKWYLGFILVIPLIFLLLLSFNNYAWLFFVLGIINIFFTVWWAWIIFERRNYAGYLSLVYVLLIIPFIDILATIAYLVIIGLVAFKDV